jgi:hypothetical protein
MTESGFDCEVSYRAALSIFQYMFEKGWLTRKELTLLNRQLVEKYKPIIGSL